MLGKRGSKGGNGVVVAEISSKLISMRFGGKAGWHGAPRVLRSGIALNSDD